MHENNDLNTTSVKTHKLKDESLPKLNLTPNTDLNDLKSTMINTPSFDGVNSNQLINIIPHEHINLNLSTGNDHIITDLSNLVCK